MSAISPRMLWPYPEENQDPYWDAFVDFIRALDASGFAAREDRNLILSGGGILTWDAFGAGLTWTEDFMVLSPSTGFYTQITANTLAPSDGQIIKASITRYPGQNVSAAASVANIADNDDNSFVLGARVGTTFVFRNGRRLEDGSSIAASHFFRGGIANPGQTLIWGGTDIIGGPWTRYLGPGMGSIQTSEDKLIPAPRDMTAKKMIVTYNVGAPGGVLTDTFTLRKNKIDTAAQVVIVGASTTGTWNGAVSISEGDMLSMSIVIDGASAADYPAASVYLE